MTKISARAITLITATAAVSWACLIHVANAKTEHTTVTTAKFGVTLGLDKQVYTIPKEQNSIKQMHATLTLFNLTKEPLTFAEHGQKYEWKILNDQGQVVWDYSIGRRFPHNVRMRTLTQGHIDYPADIPLQTQAGPPLQPGKYTLRGQLIGPPVTAEIGFTVTE